MKKSVFLGAIFYLPVYLSGCSGGIALPPDNEAFYRVKKTSQRVEDRAKYFKDEYLQIAEKRGLVSDDHSVDIKPENLIGLGLSGGGIRSAAFQLGIFSGLQATKSHDQAGRNLSALDKIDYLSCVSGGCWAAGAFLIADESAESFFTCLEQQARTGKIQKCGGAEGVLRSHQNLKLIKKEKKEDWEKEIAEAYFPEKCKKFSFNDRKSSCWNNLKGKPNIIFNVAHSTLSPNRYGANIDNLPFQITPNQLGTIVDCGSSGLEGQKCGGIKGGLAGKDKVGFFVRQDAEDFSWVRRERSGKHLWLKKETEPGSQMSKAMAHSSALIGSPRFLSFSMGLTYKSMPPEEEIRDNYFLTDGGYVENLGLLALIERGVDLIVLSDMGYPEREGDDLDMAIAQVKKLLKCDVTGKENINPDNLVSTLHYTCPNVPQEQGVKQGKILYVRPYPDNIEAFKQELQLEQEELYQCISANDYSCYEESPLGTPGKESPLDPRYQFPQTSTMLTSYDERLIRSYFLLGQFIGKRHIGPALLR